ncbi:hypothetical protein LOZ58_001484 [Ophidiomyces ophidiicola]|nr:hypothetical protein LOZ58_001484 [Ophidiomyces ophidiicola]
MAPKGMIPILVTMMLVTGVCNTLLTKYQDMQCVRNCDDPDPKKRVVFEQPVLQTLQMFIGEMGCWLVLFGINTWNRHIRPRLRGPSSAPLFAGGYEPVSDGSADPPPYDDADADDALGNGPKSHDSRVKLRGTKILLLAAPACCDISGTTLMNIGLLFVVASIYQMTRGALVLFVGLFSVVFLRRKLYLYQWMALVCVVFGVGLVGLAGAIFKDHGPVAPDNIPQLVSRAAQEIHSTAKSPEAVKVIVGVLLIAGAQIFTASQFVLEEWILERYAMDPLMVVGWEGIFGTLVTTFGMFVLHLAIGRTEHGKYGYFDVTEGWRNMTTNRTVAFTSLLIMISIGGFNYFGLSVTRSVSATSRSTIDTSRTLFIWLVSLGLGWESFKRLQVVGFTMLVYGTFLFNDIVRPPLKACIPDRSPEEAEESLLPEEPIEHM